MAQMLVRVNEKMDGYLKELEKTWDLDEIKKLSIKITTEVYNQWKDKDEATK